MKLRTFVFLTTFYWSVLLFKEILADEQIQLKTPKINDTCGEKLFSLDDIDDHRVVRKGRKLRSGVLDCFGIGSQFAEGLDWFLKSNSNGTMALKVKFHAISKKQPGRVTYNYGNPIELEKFDFDIKKRTVIIVHGFLADGNERWIEDMTNALLKWDDVNIFVVDWSVGSNTWNYYKAAVNTRTVGDQIATFFGQLVDAVMQSNKVDTIPYGPLHFIGHSLGAHICGYAAKEMKRRANKWLPSRITGLDPAQPCFKNSEELLRLDESDAPFVDVIHTNGRVLSRLGLGLPNPVGHVDFYPNGGKVQPGCILSQSSLWNYLPLPIKTIGETICSHGRSYLYFIDSIISSVRNGCTFWAYEWDFSITNIDAILKKRCNSKRCIEMGINAEKYSYQGTFLTITGRTKPFCKVDKGSAEEAKDIIEKVKKKLNCQVPVNPENQTLVVYG